MNPVELILLLLAYSIGLITIIIQLICYRKKMENLVTILFAASFLFLIVVLTAQGLGNMYSNRVGQILEPLLSWAMLFLGLTTALNIHQERIFGIRNPADKLVIGLFVMAGITVLILQLVGEIVMSQLIASVIMFAAIAWGMGLVLATKPAMSIHHRNQIERQTSWLFFGLVILLAGLYLAQEFFPQTGLRLPDGPYIVSLFFIFLCIGKILDDLKRLSLLSDQQPINPHMITNLGISPRETEVMDLLMKGSSYQQIADQLFISLPTVKTHVSNIYRKAGVSNKVGLINLINTLR